MEYAVLTIMDIKVDSDKAIEIYKILILVK